MEENSIYTDYLLPKLNSFNEFLKENGIRAEVSMDIDEIPGLMLFLEQDVNLFITFIEEDMGVPELMRMTASYYEGKELKEDNLRFRSILVDPREITDLGELEKCIKLALSGKSLVPYPSGELIEGDPAGEALLPRTNTLARAIVNAGAEDVEVVTAGIPFVIATTGEVAFVSAFEEIAGEEYLMHFRADIPYDLSEDIEELRKDVELFNEEHFFVKASLDFEDPGVFSEENEKVITFHAFTRDVGAAKDDEYYAFFASLFESEVLDFFE